jgi:hypothetical protein
MLAAVTVPSRSVQMWGQFVNGTGEEQARSGEIWANSGQNNRESA